MYSRIARHAKFSEVVHRIDQTIVVSQVEVKNRYMCGELVTNLSACPAEREAASLPPLMELEGVGNMMFTRKT